MDNPSKPLIKMTNISKIYKNNKFNKVEALNNLNLTVYPGDFISIKGASGSGKSTLLNIIGFLDNQTDGDYLFNGINTKTMNDSRKSDLRNQNIAFILQDFGLIEDETTLYNVCLPLLFTDVKIKDIKKRSENLLIKLGLGNYKHQLVKNLSGGQKQRVAIARALVIEPDLILADEPTGSLDSKTGAEIMKLLKDLNLEKEVTIILVTHDEEISNYAKIKKYMHDGDFI